MNQDSASLLDRLENSRTVEFIGSLVMLGLLLALVVAAFFAADRGLQAIGLSSSVWASVGIWVFVGVVCALYWPLRYRKGMEGHWPAAIPHIAFLSLTGPFALLLGIPM